MSKRSKTVPFLVLGLALGGGSFFSACAEEPVDCSAEREGKWAIEIAQLEPSSCEYEGTVVFEGVEEEMTCGNEGDTCICRAGDSFGEYEVWITDLSTGQTDRAVIDVEIAPSPSCVTRSAVERFSPLGGAGGMTQ